MNQKLREVAHRAIRLQDSGDITVHTDDGLEHQAVRFGAGKFVAKCQLVDHYEQVDVTNINDDLFVGLSLFDVPREEPVTCVRCLGDDGPRS